jgi:formylglycine-generating enzyme required for sulfatase activity
MVGIPSGTFPMGGTIDEGDADEQPQHPVNLTTYFIDKCEVSNRQYRKFCDLTHRAYPQDPGFPNMPDYIRGFPNYPVVNVTWNDAVAYCAWAGKRLPTEAEWEKAARGPEWSKYPWGNSIRSAAGKHVANYNPGDFQGDGYERTSPVDSFASGASPYGSLNMGGNVWEWCSDWYDDGYYRVSPRDNPQGPRSGAQRVYRGGGWFTGSRQMRCSERSSAPPERYLHYLGFRCVVSGTTNAGS